MRLRSNTKHEELQKKCLKEAFSIRNADHSPDDTTCQFPTPAASIDLRRSFAFMPKIPTNHISSDPTLDYIHTTSCNFVDSNGRTLLLRGVNLSGSSKAPVTQPSQKHEGFWETAEKGGTSFIGRPLNLDDGSADEHLARLKGWGFTMLRFPVTWEALEHEGPGKYDYEFMDYTVRVLRKCKEYGFKVFMDPHQDVWSRFTGGSGAPFWTLAACGINPAGLTPTLSSIIHSEWPSVENPDPAHIPAMIWGTNYSRLASMTLFTFFFAGREYAPKCILDGKNIQDWLQSYYIAAFGELADRIVAASDLADSCVIGWDSMNEPHHGMVGIENLVKPVSEGTSQLKKGPTPTPIQSLCLGMGKAQILDDWDFGAFGPVKTGKVTIDPKGVRLWASGVDEEDGVNKRWGWRRDPGWQLGSCPWAQHGVWEPASGQVLRPAYFACTDFIDQFWRPHFIAWAKRMRQAQPQAILFVAPPVFARPPQLEEDVLQGRACLSAHYYDGLTLVTRHWNWFNADALGVLRGRYSHPAFGVKIGEAAIRKSLREQLAELKADATILGNYPTIIGEIGIPYDMDGKRAYGYTDDGRYKGDYSAHQTALDASLNACDGPSALNYTVWTYCPDSTHEWGDGWNMEDLSLWSADDARVKSPALHRGSGSVIKTPSITVVKAAAESSVSVASSRALGASPGSWRNMYDFLTDGARAVKAFSRPYPMATVGIPSSIDFDINNAEFRLEVRVRAEDASPPPNLLGSPTPSAISANLADDPSFSSKPTEIFLPLVHFVHSSLLNQADALDTGLSGPPITPQLSESSTTLLSGSGMDVLALDVTVSAGRWDADGQVLRWWYPVPAGDEEGEVTYNITVRRAGGAIKEMDTGSLQACAEWCGASGNGCLLM